MNYLIIFCLSVFILVCAVVGVTSLRASLIFATAALRPPVVVPLRKPRAGQDFLIEDAMKAVSNAAARFQKLPAPFPEVDLIPDLKQYGESCFEHAQAEIEDEYINRGELPENYRSLS